MKKRNNSEKDFKQAQEIAEVIIALKGQRSNMERTAQEYYESALQAARLGQDEFANECLESMDEFEQFASDLKYLELKVETAAITAQTMKKLKELPAAFKMISKISCEAPNFEKMGGDLAKLLGDLKTAREQLKEFRQGFGKTKDPIVSKIMGSTYSGVKDEKREARIAEKKRRLEADLVLGAKAEAPVAAASTVTANSQENASIDDIAKLYDDVKGGK